MAEMVEPKRLALMAALLQGQIARTLDDLADMFVRQMQRIHARAKEALAVHQLQQLEHTGGLSHCCATPCWLVAATNRRSSGWPPSRPCSCPTPMPSWNAARRTPPPPTMATFRSCPASTAVTAGCSWTGVSQTLA